MNKPRSFAPLIATVLLLLPVLYVASYFALVVPAGIPKRSVVEIAGKSVPCTSFDDHYRAANLEAEFFFYPLEQIDRKLRPKAWETDIGDFTLSNL